MARDTVSTPKFSEARQKFVSIGITPKALIPIAPPGAKISKTSDLKPEGLGKAPGRYNARLDEWSGLHGSAVVKGMRPEDQDAAANWPTGNVGILGRVFPAIDSDAMSPAARRLVDEIVVQEFGEDAFAERIRGKNDRRLYAFKAANPGTDPVRTRHVMFKLPGEDVTHKVDIIGLGGQFLIAGTHPSGDAYEWRKGAELYNREVVRDLLPIGNEDITRFLEALEDRVNELGGEFQGRTSTGSNLAKDPSELDPTFDNETIFRGLDRIPNNEDTFPHRDDLVSFCAAVRAAAGRNSDDPDFVDEIRAWATEDASWCDDSYFDKVWDSLRYVRATPDTLDRIFRKNGVFHQSAQNFDHDTDTASEVIQSNKAAAKQVRGDLLGKIAARYVFRDVNTAEATGSVLMRHAWDVAEEWPAVDWFLGETTRRDNFQGELTAEYGPKKGDFWNFAAALKQRHPECFYFGFVQDPYHEYGEIVVEVDKDSGYTRNMLNMRHLPATIRAAKKADKNPSRSARDVQTILEFVDRLFGKKLAQYELDTLAFMVQKKRRPGAMLFLVGDPGVGKSTYTQLNIAMFNGARPEQMGIIDGTKLVNENSRRFALAGIEGCRIVSIKEMPKGRANSGTLKQITSILKQLVDPGIEGDFIQIERKGRDTQIIKNFARVVVSSNHADSIEIETHDRRIFMVESQINLDNRPEEAYYQEINDIIQNPERLAAFYRYLETRDIGQYTPNAAPPVSSAKMERIVSNLENPVERHMRAAVQWLEFSGRTAFTMLELAELMRDCAEAEFQNTGGGADDRADYPKLLEDKKDRVAVMAGLRNLGKLTVKTERQRRDAKRQRIPALYLLKDYASKAKDLDDMALTDFLDFLEGEEDRSVVKEHPWALYRMKGA